MEEESGRLWERERKIAEQKMGELVTGEGEINNHAESVEDKSRETTGKKKDGCCAGMTAQ